MKMRRQIRICARAFASFFVLILYSQSLSDDRCRVIREKPVTSTNQGGYSFDYYSILGSNCRLFRVRNHPGGLKTPVLWKSSVEVFFNAILAECPASAANCGWIEVSKSAWKPYEDKTLLTYGVNRDEYKEEPEAFCEAQRQPTLKESLLPMITSIIGSIGDADGKPVVLGIRVSSSVAEISNDGFKIRYVISALPKASPFVIGSSQTSADLDDKTATIIWEAVDSSTFLQQLSKAETKRLEPGATLTIDVPARKVEVGWQSLIVMKDGKRIFTTTAPAYKPKPE